VLTDRLVRLKIPRVGDSKETLGLARAKETLRHLIASFME